DLPSGGESIFAGLPFLRQYAVVLLADMVVFAVFTLIAHLYTSQDELRTERGKKHLAQFQYNKLKMQINPHFLFNSLNILDYLVQEGQTERASAFIRKLADSYRYMLKTEDEPLVTLQEEVDFAHKYSELLQERFASGFTVHYQIDDQLLSRSIVPCCLQLLIENATKHNIVSPERPLTIFVCAEGDTLTVRNNIQPRITAQASTGTGLKNIRQQYLDICNRPISVEKTQSEFIVNIPLL
ncbi:MAG: histidine kinase, partial [Rikenellaceae bacterium]|nr:histidine kinase [Rikenellaceae bacterium]